MKCAEHPERETDHVCALCRNPVCYMCERTISEGIYLCVECFKKQEDYENKLPQPRERKLPLPLLKSNTLILLSIIILGSVLRLYHLDYKSLWMDEIWSVIQSKASLPQIISSPSRVSPFFLLILHFFTRFSSSEFIVRLPSVIFGVLAIALTYKVGKLFFGPKEGLIGAFLLSISPMHIKQSQDARLDYPLLVFFSLLSLFFFYKVLETGGTKQWLYWLISTFLCVVSHYYGLLILTVEFPLLVFKIFRDRNSIIKSIRNENKRTLILVFLVLFALSIPSLRLLPLFLTLISGWAWDVPFGLQTSSFFIDLFNNFSVNLDYYSQAVIQSHWALYTMVLCLLAGIVVSIRKYKMQSILLSLWIFQPIIIVFGLSIYFKAPVATAKYLIFVLPAYLIVASRGIVGIADSLSGFRYFLAERKLVSIFLCLAITTSIPIAATKPLVRQYGVDDENWRAASAYLEKNSLRSDLIIVEPDYCIEDVQFYYNVPDLNIMSTGGSIANLEDIASTYSNFWFVYSGHAELIDSQGIRDWLNRNCVIRNVTGGIIIYQPQEEAILVSTKDMRFEGLDNLANLEATFYHDGDTATFLIDVSKATNYTIAIHSLSMGSLSSVETIIDGVPVGVKTFFVNYWVYVELSSTHLEPGQHEIKIINREKESDSNIAFDQVAILPNGVHLKD